MISQESQVANLANSIIGITQSLDSLRQQISTISSQWTSLSAATKLNAFPTAAPTTTGGLGTADGSSNVANPIDTRTPTGALVTRAISANNVAGLLTYLQGVQSVVNGSAVSANGAAGQLVALCL